MQISEQLKDIQSIYDEHKLKDTVKKEPEPRLLKYHKIVYDGMLDHTAIQPPEWDINRLELIKQNKLYFVQEKIDGMQFRVKFNHIDNEIIYGSHNVIFDETMKICDKWSPAVKSINNAISLFKTAYTYEYQNAQNITFFMEYLPEIRTNKIKYERVPLNNIVLFDAVYTYGDNIMHWVTPDMIRDIAMKIQLEPVMLYGIYNTAPSDEIFKKLMETAVSSLGNVKPEGFVVKSALYSYYPDTDRKEPYAYKWVRDSFKEFKPKDWKNNKSPTDNDNDFISSLLNINAVIDKAIIRAEETGKLQNNMSDMKIITECLMKEFEDEYDAYLKDKIYDYFKKKLIRNIMHNLKYAYEDRIKELKNETIKDK